jgi:hypothetical protein
MRLQRTRTVTLAVVLAFAGLYAVFAVLAAAPALASGPITVLILDDPNLRPMLDEGGHLIGYAEHQGGLRCEGIICGQETEMQNIAATVPVTDYTYSFANLITVSGDEETIVVEGTGVMSSRDVQAAEFSFVATFKINPDRTVYARYDATLPEASFTIPRTSGSIEFN